MRIKSLRFHHLSPFPRATRAFVSALSLRPGALTGVFYFVLFLAGSYLALTPGFSVRVLLCRVPVSVDISGQFTLTKR